jgi:hypothetical protein
LEELEKIVGFTIQDLKKLKSILIEIALEYKHLNIEQLKALFFELFEKLEDRIVLESKNNSLLKTSFILENPIRINRQTLHCQDVVGPILKILLEKGITEIEIVSMKALIDILLYNSSTIGNNITKTNIKYENVGNLSNNSNNIYWKKEYEKLKCPLILNLILVLILNAVNLDKIQCNIDRFRTFYSSSFPIISSYEDSDNKKQKGVADTIIGDNDTNSG